MGDARFCSRCGMPLHLISEIVANSGFALHDPAGAKTRSPRQKGMRLGGILMFIAAALAPIFFAMCFLVRGGGPLFVPSSIFFVGLCWLLYSRLFLDETTSSTTDNRLNQFSNAQPKSFTLLPDRMPMVSTGPRRVHTADIPQSPGVTEHTTQFFD